MKLKNLNVQLLKFPSEIEFTIYLIKEDLRSSKFFNTLASVGFEDNPYRSDFSTMVLASIGFEDRSDALYELYYNLLNKYAKKVESDNKKIIKVAFNLYVDLIIEKRKAINDSDSD